MYAANVPVTGALRPLSGLPRPAGSSIQVPAVLEQPAAHLAVLAQDAQQRLRLRGPHVPAQRVQHVDLRQDRADQAAGAEHLVRAVILTQGPAEVTQHFRIDPGILLAEHAGQPAGLIGVARAGHCCREGAGREELTELAA